MGKRDYLGEFEQLCLLAVVRLDTDAYGVTVLQELKERTGREPNVASIYAALDRLEKKGFVSSKLGDGTGAHGGRPKRYFEIEPAGIDALILARRMHDSMWDGVDL
jgi:DNA-binding PadR family transcriptional regulator